MKKVLLLALVMAFNFTFAQQAWIKVETVTPHMTSHDSSFTGFNSVATGLRVNPIGTYVYFSPWNAEAAKMDEIPDSLAISDVTWELVTTPSGSAAAFEAIPEKDTWNALKLDVEGKYEVKLSITTSLGTDDTTIAVYGAKYVGTGGYDGVATKFPQCMSCHGSNDKFSAIFDKWKESGHGTIFTIQVENNNHYGENCMKCHTVGYDHNIEADNNGFDDVAVAAGWAFDPATMMQDSTNWDSIVTYFPDMVAFANIGCEMCHGPGSQHNGNLEGIQISTTSGACNACHDEPWRHNRTALWENSAHSEAIWSGSFARARSANDFGNCARCHDGKGYIDFTKGIIANENGMTPADHEVIGCVTCHDPHGAVEGTTYQLRKSPAGSDTLGNGYQYPTYGAGALCMDCHKARRDVVAYTADDGSLSSHWGPHHSTQTDVLLGQNAAEFGEVYTSTGNKHLTANFDGNVDACVDCHMKPTVATTDTANRDHVGGHSFRLHNEETGFDHVEECQNCHGGEYFQSWEEISLISYQEDYDGNGKKEGMQLEVKGLLDKVAMALPPLDEATIDYTQITTLDQRKAYWNWQLIKYDGSYGLHNPKYAIEVLQASYKTLTGIELTNDLTPKTYSLEQNYPNPFNPSTTIRFAIPNAGNVTLKVYDIIGKEVATLHHGELAAGTYNFNWNASNMASGVYFYRLSSDNFTQVKKMVLMK